MEFRRLGRSGLKVSPFEHRLNVFNDNAAIMYHPAPRAPSIVHFLYQ
jgi:hypothetical protein